MGSSLAERVPGNGNRMPRVGLFSYLRLSFLEFLLILSDCVHRRSASAVIDG